MPSAKPTSVPVENKKAQALASALAQIEKEFGKGSIMRLGDSVREAIPPISTGSLKLDLALGIGGIPEGRIIEVYGPEGSGKTSLALQIVANAQKKGYVAAYVDAEHALDPGYAGKLGVNTDEMLISQPDSGEQALEIVDTLVRSGAVNLVVVDSVAALVPKAEIDGDMGDAHVGLQARLMSQALRKLAGAAKKNNTAIVFINQIRMKIGVLFGSPETTTGGNALKFYASVRLDIRRTGSIKNSKDEVIGNTTRIKVVKNKVSPPFRVVEVELYYGQGISKLSEILDLGLDSGAFVKSGAWYSLADGTRIGQGKEKALEYLTENPEVAVKVEAEVRARLAPPTPIEEDSTEG